MDYGHTKPSNGFPGVAIHPKKDAVVQYSVEKRKRVLVLTWTQQTDGWYANGLRIELAAPFRWILVETKPEETAVVSSQVPPLAVARTLTECKREAELVIAARRRSELRRQHLGILGLLFGVGILLMGASPIQNIGVILALATLATRSLGVIAGTIFWRSSRAGHEVFYQ